MDRLNTRVHFTSTIFFKHVWFFCLKTGLKPNNLDAWIDVAGSIKALHIDIIEHACSIMHAGRLFIS